MKYLAIPVLAALVIAQPVVAAESCTPIDAATRVLQSPNPNDLSPDWMGENRIGLSWSLFVESESAEEGDENIIYLKGSLVDPRGSDAGTVFAIKREWTCS